MTPCLRSERTSSIRLSGVDPADGVNGNGGSCVSFAKAQNAAELLMKAQPIITL